MSSVADRFGPAGIACTHTQRGEPVLMVAYNNPVDPSDSGWSFTCGRDRHDDDELLVVGMNWIFREDPTLRWLLHMPRGYCAWRSNPSEQWQVAPCPDDCHTGEADEGQHLAAREHLPDDDREAGFDGGEEHLHQSLREVGWHILLIPEDEEGPTFAYTIGLYHSYQHPEVLVQGLPQECVHGMLNVIGENVKSGQSYEAGNKYAGILEGCDCVFVTIHPSHYNEYLGSAIRFYKHALFPVLQCVWPDREGRFPWEAGFPPGLASLQPVLSEPEQSGPGTGKGALAGF